MREIISKPDLYFTLILTTIAVIIVIELILRLSVIDNITSLIKTSRKSFKLLVNNAVSDNWKEKVLLSYSAQIFKQSFLVVCYMVLFILSYIFISTAHLFILSNNFDQIINHLTNPYYQTLAIFIGIAYYSFKKYI